MSSETYSITLDPDRLININEVEDFLQQQPGESYSELIDINKNILKNKTYFRDNNILNFPYKKKRNTKNNDLDISVILLCHGGSNSFGSIIEKKHDFWKGNRESHMMFNCNGESIVGIKANTVRLYSDVGYDVSITSNIYRLFIGIFYFNSITCLLLVYLILNLFRSRHDNKSYPYKKLYTIGRQSKVIPNPLKNIKNNSNVENSDFEEVTKDKNFHYYIPNSSLSLYSSSEFDENYIVFLIENNGKLQIYKFALSYLNILTILNYNGITNKKQIKNFIDYLNIADMITIIYNTIQQKILPKYNNNHNLHISLDLMFCKGSLVPENYILTRSILNECYNLTNDFGYTYIGNIRNCNTDICEIIKRLGVDIKLSEKIIQYSKTLRRKKIIIDIEEYFKVLLNLDFRIAKSFDSVGQFIEELIEKENEIYNNQSSNITIKKRKEPNTTNINSDSKIQLKQMIEFLKNLKTSNFVQKGSGKKYKAIKKSNTIKSKNKSKSKK